MHEYLISKAKQMAASLANDNSKSGADVVNFLIAALHYPNCSEYEIKNLCYFNTLFIQCKLFYVQNQCSTSKRIENGFSFGEYRE
jgi:hypothetical protein